ncbi:hypothetical protein AMECASPLE_017494, partial [Ameca splendens]
ADHQEQGPPLQLTFIYVFFISAQVRVGPAQDLARTIGSGCGGKRANWIGVVRPTLRGGAAPPLHSARRVRNERLPVTSSLFGSYIVWKAAARCWLLHAELHSELTLSCSRRFRSTILFPLRRL